MRMFIAVLFITWKKHKEKNRSKYLQIYLYYFVFVFLKSEGNIVICSLQGVIRLLYFSVFLKSLKTKTGWGKVLAQVKSTNWPPHPVRVLGIWSYLNGDYDLKGLKIWWLSAISATTISWISWRHRKNNDFVVKQDWVLILTLSFTSCVIFW